MSFRPDAETWARLRQMGSSFRFIHSKEGVLCEIVDSENGKPYAVSPVDEKTNEKHQTEEAALVAAINVAKISDKPMTTAEMVADHRRLKKELEELKARHGESDDSFDDDPYEGMKPTELAAELKKRELEEPPGNRRTKVWRNEAIDMLRQPA